MIRRLGLCSAGLFALALCGGPPAAAGDAPGVTGEMIEETLKAMNLPYGKGQGGPGVAVLYVLKVNNRPMTLIPLGGGAKLLIKVPVAAQPSLQVLNRYNEEKAITTRAVRYQREGLILEAGLDCRAGVTPAMLKQFITGFVEDLRDFEQFVGAKGAAVELPPVVETPEPADKPQVEKPQVEKPKKDDKRTPDGTAEGNPGRPQRPIVEGPNTPVNPKPGPVVEGPAVPAVPLKGATGLKVTPGSNDRELEIAFPVGDPQPETAWKIVWDVETAGQANSQGFKFRPDRGKAPLLFKIKKASFRPGPQAPWFQVLEDAHPSEFYVPYYFQKTRFFDLRDHGQYVPLLAREGGPRSKLLGAGRYVMAEVRDRGLAYKFGQISRRGEQLVLWANFQAGNYTYVVEFDFHDDGTVAFKHAPTGYNFFDHFESASHMHNCLWRIGVKLAPEGQDRVVDNRTELVRLDAKQAGPQGKLDVQPITTESFHDWKGEDFTRIRITNPHVTVFPQSNKRPQLPIGYDLVPLLQGQARHQRAADEAFSLHDFWVTRPDCPEKMYINLPGYFRSQEQPRPLENGDGVVLWHMSSALHVPRSEDGIYSGNNPSNGQALVSFTTVELRPRNLFLRTPLYRPFGK